MEMRLPFRRRNKSAVKNGHGLPQQGCQMVYFQTKNPDLGKFWRALE
jgi:hypothetical protein